MHKSVFYSNDVCAQSSVLYTPQIPQHILCGEFPNLHTNFPSLIQSLYTGKIYVFDLLFGSFTRYTQALLLELLLINKLIEGIL